MIELRDYKIEVASQYAKYKNNPIVFNNGYDSVPNPYKLEDAANVINLQLERELQQRKLIYWNNQFVGEIGIEIKKDVFRLGAEMGYFYWRTFLG